MKILILSDSHYARLDNIKFEDYDYVIHCGDYGYSQDILEKNNVIYVKGNCDIYGPSEVSNELFGEKIYVTHGHLYGVKDDYIRIMYKGLSKSASYVFFGHTHRPDMQLRDDIVLINPGAYQDGYYLVIEDNRFIFYKDEKIYKEFRRKW